MNRTKNRCLIRAATLLLVLTVRPGATLADSALNVEMTGMATQIKLLLDQKGHDAIAVGEFRGPARLVSSAGPAISKALIDALKKHGVPGKRRAALEVNGEYRDAENPRTKLMAVAIKAHIVDGSGAEIVAFEPRDILDMTTIASLLGPTVSIPSDGTDQERDRALRGALRNPNVHVTGSRIAADSSSPYAVEVLVNSGGQPLPRPATKDDDGLAFVKIGRGEVYAVRLINDSPHDAAVALTIDGLSVFAFSANPNYTHWVVPSKKSLIVPGWHRTNSVSDSFQITEVRQKRRGREAPEFDDRGDNHRDLRRRLAPGRLPSRRRSVLPERWRLQKRHRQRPLHRHELHRGRSLDRSSPRLRQRPLRQERPRAVGPDFDLGP